MTRNDDGDAAALVDKLRREVWPDLTDDEIVVKLAGLAMYLKKWEARHDPHDEG